MIPIIKNIEAEILPNYTGDLYYFSSIEGQIGYGDYINIGGLTGYLQNFSKVNYSENLTKPQFFGLKNQYNLPIVTLNISY